jgi:hypothetical protein
VPVAKDASTLGCRTARDCSHDAINGWWCGGIVMAFGSMPRLTDKNEIRTRLRRDPAWSVYALGDLAPPMFPKTLWFMPDLTLLVRDYGTTILFAMGPGSVREALECVAGPVHLQVQRDALDEVARHAAVSSPRLMWRAQLLPG